MSARKTLQCSRCGTGIYNNTKTGMCYQCYVADNEEKTIAKWLATGDSGHQPISTIKGPVRRYLYKDQDNCCAICGMSNEWNGKDIKFVLDHINGNAADNRRENLRLVCPNCDSQLDTFKSKNKNSARTYRKPKNNDN